MAITGHLQGLSQVVQLTTQASPKSWSLLTPRVPLHKLPCLLLLTCLSVAACVLYDLILELVRPARALELMSNAKPAGG